MLSLDGIATSGGGARKSAPPPPRGRRSGAGGQHLTAPPQQPAPRGCNGRGRSGSDQAKSKPPSRPLLWMAGVSARDVAGRLWAAGDELQAAAAARPPATVHAGRTTAPTAASMAAAPAYKAALMLAAGTVRRQKGAALSLLLAARRAAALAGAAPLGPWFVSDLLRRLDIAALAPQLALDEVAVLLLAAGELAGLGGGGGDGGGDGGKGGGGGGANAGSGGSGVRLTPATAAAVAHSAWLCALLARLKCLAADAAPPPTFADAAGLLAALRLWLPPLRRALGYPLPAAKRLRAAGFGHWLQRELRMAAPAADGHVESPLAPEELAALLREVEALGLAP